MQNIIVLALLAAILPTAVAITLAMSRTTPGKYPDPPRRSRAEKKALRAEGNR